MKTPVTLFLALVSMACMAGPGDTTIVQTYTFEAQNNPETAYDSPGRRWFEFPSSDNGLTYQKILMYHTLKCFEDGTAGNLGFPCGEWDYLTYNFLFQHTGMLDSTVSTHPLYLVDNANFTTMDFHGQPAYNTYQYDQMLTVATTLEENIYTIGNNDMPIAGPFSTNAAQRSQYLYRADELINAGFTAGSIDKIGLDFLGSGGSYQRFQIRIKPTTASELTGFEYFGTAANYYLDIANLNSGWNEFILTSPFNWDGTSNLLIEFSYTDDELTPAPSCTGQSTSYYSAFHSSGNDRFIDLDGNDIVQIPAETFNSISDEITISLWVYGNPEFQPENGTIFEARNAQNQRVLNVHLPWGNGWVYWDAGFDGGYDRIEKLAPVASYEGQWSHWAFTKNTTTGEMKMYLNGELFHSGTGKDNLMEDITGFNLGGAITWSNFYRGSIDEFTVWNTELSQSEIQDLMYYDLVPTPGMLLYYKFNEENGNLVTDHSGNGFDGTPLGNSNRKLHLGHDLFRNGGIDYIRPQLAIYSGEYELENTYSTASYQEMIAPVSVAEYAVNGNFIELQNVYYDWLTGESYTYDPWGSIVGFEELWSAYVLENDTLDYYQAPFEVINRYELGRYITPYGIQLDLEDGWTWVFDVTDFAPLLRDSVELEAGNWQELLDLKFVFIEGTPAREVKRIENFWVGNYGLSNMDEYVTDRTFEMEEDEVGLKLRTVATGHGFGSGNNCAEFCYNTHSVQVNGNQEWSWEIMHECDDNALYPQGGTWIYARAGWCPGKEGKLEEFELTPFIQNGEVTVDYDIEADPYGNYVFESQMVTYGPLNHQTDVEINQIIAPSTFKLNSRINPMCDNPVIRIRNLGAQPLTSCIIQFGIVGGASDSYTWTGNLGFDEYEDVVLTSTDPNMWAGDDEELLTFFAQVTYPNDLFVDENTYNDYATSTFYRPPVYTYGEGEDDDNRMIVVLKTNNAYWESECTLYDMNGNVVWHRDDYSAGNTTYRDTLTLNAGCYMFLLDDTGDDGLNFFANNDGNGDCRLDRVQGLDFKIFEDDFGADIRHYFYFDTDLVSVNESTIPAASLSVYPNPVDEMCRLDISGFSGMTEVEMHDMSGRKVKSLRINAGVQQSTYLRVNDLAAGVYTLTARDHKQMATTRVVVK